MQDKNLINLKGVSKNFKETNIFNDVDLKVKEGEVIGIIGSNGCGKTTLLKIIMGLVYPSSGEVIINGKKVEPGFVGSLPTNIGALIETPIFLPYFTGLQNLSMLASIRDQITNKDIKKIMTMVGLDPDNKKSTDKYSLGMRQRLGIAQAIMENPQIVLFDEPTNALDSDGIEMFTKIVEDMKSKGTSFVIVSHRKEEIDTLCDRVYEVKNGKVNMLEVGCQQRGIL